MASLILNLQRKAQSRNEIHISFYINHWESSLCVRVCGRTMATLTHLSSNTFSGLQIAYQFTCFYVIVININIIIVICRKKIVAISCYQRTWYMLQEQVLSVTPIWSTRVSVCVYFSLIITFSIRQKIAVCFQLQSYEQ